MTKKFNGFPEEMFVFLDDLTNNNSREWFTANKDRYEKQVVRPVQQFIVAVGEFLPSISPALLASPKRVGGSMFRIYRDTRFSRDKRPYKENVGCQFRHHRAHGAHSPGFYVHLAPDEVFVGGGLWKPESTSLGRVRQAIHDSPESWKEVVTNKSFSRYFGMLQGESLKRPPRGFETEHPFIDDIKRKSFVVFRDLDPRSANSAGFLKEVEKAFNIASPLLAFLSEALGYDY